ncbi:MAG: mercury methylation ferredoxin HgcB [candidate division WOR-3 bacterium]
MAELIYLKNVVTLQMRPELCVGCGTCLDVCPRAVFARNNGKVEIVNRDACIECGACSRNCAAEALSVRAGVGCAHALINAALGRTDAACCSVGPEEKNAPRSGRTSCC